jgi:hypothetical protein
LSYCLSDFHLLRVISELLAALEAHNMRAGACERRKRPGQIAVAAPEKQIKKIINHDFIRQLFPILCPNRTGCGARYYIGC